MTQLILPKATPAKPEKAEADPVLELTADEMILVHDWLLMAHNDVTKQVEALQPSAIHTNETRKKLETEVIGITFLQNWLVAVMQQIEAALDDMSENVQKRKVNALDQRIRAYVIELLDSLLECTEVSSAEAALELLLARVRSHQ